MFYRSSYRNKEGFSLVELLVVIAIIGILAAVGITAYSGYTANAKEKAATAQNKDIINLLNSEFAKCASGEGTYVWSTTMAVTDMDTMITTDVTTLDGCDTDPDHDNIVTYINDVLGLNNPYETDAVAAAAGTTPPLGQTHINCAGDACAVTTDIAGADTTPVTVSTY